ncbi:levansucrase [Novosphingobium kunmingense]|uniref:Levansucrase n=1 Tax=Novosphingobium kunmingense TaxID=1211806 RepID=A0A2N0H3G5_9SPHN|nr:glycoside hydrolase family 68 protein [Novosphingobium kunmingense]PKB13474.1 levansucrase [Novosphingobium kunmingense]
MNKPDLRRTGAAPSATSRWQPAALSGASIALIGADHVTPILPGLDLWDSWPLAHEDGRTVEVEGRQYWFFLSAACFDDPGDRHNAAKIRLASLGADGWQDHGNCLPDALSPGSREWAGSAVLHDDGNSATLFFTAAGRRGEAHSFEQRLFAARGVMSATGPSNWSSCEELLRPDGHRYFVANEGAGTPGMIKAFRDPAWLRDPATGQAHLLFTGSAGWDDAAFNGVIGLATLSAGGNWKLEDPLVEAVGVNNELERPHVLVRDGRYYLFWSTQRRTFDPASVNGPNGLYAMVADRLAGPYRPVNGNGLVAGNPESEPTQGYSWWVTGEGNVWSFIDHWGMRGRSFSEHPDLLRSHFGGTPAPIFRLAFAGDLVTIA